MCVHFFGVFSSDIFTGGAPTGSGNKSGDIYVFTSMLFQNGHALPRKNHVPAIRHDLVRTIGRFVERCEISKPRLRYSKALYMRLPKEKYIDYS